jgi:hypothetical protein
LPVFSLLHCHPGPSSKGESEKSGEVPEYRKEIKQSPVAVFKEKTNNPLNDWYFSVQLYETKKTFYYLLKMRFEEVTGEDTLKLPDFDIEPKPALVKGKDPFSCIIGFYDKENKFREYKLVSVKEGRELKLTTLNHYTVVRE